MCTHLLAQVSLGSLRHFTKYVYGLAYYTLIALNKANTPTHLDSNKKQEIQISGSKTSIQNWKEILLDF